MGEYDLPSCLRFFQADPVVVSQVFGVNRPEATSNSQ